jgi:probable phosphoglycerate mutase
MELIVVRHGRPVHIEEADGPADPDLSDVGKAQAELTAGFLAGMGVNHIVASPLKRAAQTAAPLAARLGLAAETIDGLAEYDHDASSYVPAEIQRVIDPDAFHADPMDNVGDDALEFVDVVTTTFRALIAANPGRRVAAFCHGMVTSVWFAHVLGLRGPTQFVPDYCGVSRLLASTSTDVITVRTFNEVGHLGETYIPLF